MYIGVGDLSDVVSWFNQVTTTEEMLCFLLAGTVRDAEFLASIFDHRGTVSLTLGPEVALFFFSRHGRLSQLVDPPEEWMHIYVPGEVVQVGPSRHGPRWRPVSIDEVIPEARSEILMKTETMAYDICRYFKLDPRTALPCIVILTKNNPEPFVVPTLGAASLSRVLKFFRALRDIAVLLSVDGYLSLPSITAEALGLRDEVAKLEAEEAQILARTHESINMAISLLDPYDLGLAVREEITPDSAQRIFEILGLHRQESQGTRGVPSERRPSAEVAIQDQAVHAELRRLKSLARQYSAIRSRVLEARRRSESLLSMELIEKVFDGERLQTVEDRLNDVLELYEGKFKWDRRFRSLRDVAAAVSKVANVLPHVASAKKALEALAETGSGQSNLR